MENGGDRASNKQKPSMPFVILGTDVRLQTYYYLSRFWQIFHRADISQIFYCFYNQLSLEMREIMRDKERWRKSIVCIDYQSPSHPSMSCICQTTTMMTTKSKEYIVSLLPSKYQSSSYHHDIMINDHPAQRPCTIYTLGMWEIQYCVSTQNNVQRHHTTMRRI